MNEKPELRLAALQLLGEQPFLSDREIARRVGLGHKTISRLRVGVGRPTDPPEEFTAAKIAERAGVSSRQIRRWRQHRLIPEPERFWIGKRQVCLYPETAIGWLSAIRRLMARYRQVDLVALGLFAEGYPLPEQTVRDAYVAGLANVEETVRWITPLLTASADPAHDAPFDAFVSQVARSRSFAVTRRTVRAIRASGFAQADLSAIDLLSSSVLGLLPPEQGRVGAVEDLIGITGLPTAVPEADHALMAEAVSAGVRLDVQRETAMSAPIEEIRSACDEVVTLVIGFIALFDSGSLLTDQVRDEEGHQASLSALFVDDPAMLARLALSLATTKRQPTLSAFAGWIDELYPPAIAAVQEALRHFGSVLPQLDVLASRYLGPHTLRQARAKLLIATTPNAAGRVDAVKALIRPPG